MKEIVVATTFRDFKGTENDNIQHLFLDSLKKQTYKNWRLAITIYAEKNVAKTIKQKEIPAIFYKGTSGEYRFSHSEVLINGLSSAKSSTDVIVWTTCDVIFEENFFSSLVKEDFDVCTSHPHYMFSSVENFQNKRQPRLIINEGIDTLAFSKSFLLKGLVKKDLSQYFFTNWGIFEHFLVAVSSVHKARMINIWGLSDISKIVNDRKVTKEGKKYLEDSWNENYKVFAQFLKAYKLNNDFLNLTYLHTRFTPLGTFKYYRRFNIQRLKFFYNNNMLIDRVKRKFRRITF